MASHHFQVTQKSHATASSEIFEAVSPDGDRYLIEVVNAPDGRWLEAFQRDRAVIASLRHPCFLEVRDVGGNTDGRPVIIFERPAGVTLERWLARGHVAPTHAAMELLTDLAHALGCAHDAGVSHGALTADDVVLVELGQHALGFPRLRGFGYRWLRPAPGQWTVPAPRAEIAADIAALAVLADRLLTPLRASAQITSVVRAATLLGQDGRFATPTAFVEALEAALDPKASFPEEMTEPTLKVPWGLRHRGARRVLVTAAATVLLGAGVHALVSAHNAPAVSPPPAPAPNLSFSSSSSSSLASRSPAPPPVPVKPPPVLTEEPPAPPPEVVKAAPPRAAKPAPRPRKLWRVWSQSENRLITVDENGTPVDPQPAAPAN